MAEQSSHDVVNQTRSGGEISPSDVPANKPDNITAGGDAGVVEQHISNNDINDNDNDSKAQQRPNTKTRENPHNISGMPAELIPEISTVLENEAVSFCLGLGASCIPY